MTGLLLRVAGNFLWQRARPETLPVPPQPDTEFVGSGVLSPSARRMGQVNRWLTWLVLLLSLGTLGVAGIAWRSLRSIQHQFLLNPPGSSLIESADRLERSLNGAWWTVFYPDYRARLGRAALAIRDGREALDEAAEAYRVVGGELNALGLAGRILHGPELITPVARALEQVTLPWHHETQVYQEIQARLQPYLELQNPETMKLTGTVIANSTQHAVLLSLRDPAGRTLVTSPHLPVGGRFELPVVPEATLWLTDLARTSEGEAYRVVEDLEVPLERWNAEESRFPRFGAAVSFRFDGQIKAKAPDFPPLSPSARAELDSSS